MKSLATTQQQQRGVALVMSLLFLVVISVLVVGYLASSRLDSSASNSHLERMRATLMANEGVQQVASALQQSAMDPPKVDSGPIPRNWVSGPGMLITTDPVSTDRTKLTRQVLLSSGQASAATTDGVSVDPIYRAPNLNLETLVDQTPVSHLLSEQKMNPDDPASEVVKMPVKWIYVRKSGTYLMDSSKQTKEVPETADLKDTSDPVVGRFAYWSDDEGAKVNYNTAYLRDSTYNNFPQGHQTNVDLRGLTGFTPDLAKAIHEFITKDNYVTIQNRFYNSPFDVRQAVDTSNLAAFEANRFNLTNFNSDPDTTYYGRSRMVLTTQLSNAVYRKPDGSPLVDSKGKYITRPFLDILVAGKDPMAYVDPGLAASAVVNGVKPGNIDPAKYKAVVLNLIDNYLKRTDWPMVDGTGHSIQEKYYSFIKAGTLRDRRLAQLAINIIDYVRSAESKYPIVHPIRCQYDSKTGDLTPDFEDRSIQGGTDTFKGLTRAPMITEAGAWAAITPDASGKNAGKYHVMSFVEVFLPKGYGDDLTVINWAGMSNGLTKDILKWTLYNDFMTGKSNSSGGGISVEPYVGDPADAAGSYCYLWNPATGKAAPSSFYIQNPGEYRIICTDGWQADKPVEGAAANMRLAISWSGARVDVVPLTSQVPCKLDLNPAHNPVGAKLSILSTETNDPRVNGLKGDWTKVASSTYNAVNSSQSSAPTAGIVPEQDMDTAGKISTASLRMPALKGSPKNPLGVVLSAGELGYIHTGIEGSESVGRLGVPWRTLHLQPSSQDTTVVPDWAFIDLFTVPSETPSSAAASVFSPHSNSTGGRVNLNAKPLPFDLARSKPLSSVFYHVKKTTGSTAVMSSSEGDKVAAAIYNHTWAPGTGKLSGGKRYPKVGAEAFYSPGQVCEVAGVADRGEESEETVREIINLVTARSNVFSVYTVGQALKQTPAGKLIVTAEQRQQSVMERYTSDKTTPEQDDDEVHLRVLYTRNLTP